MCSLGPRAIAVLGERMGVHFPALTFATHYQVLTPTPWNLLPLLTSEGICSHMSIHRDIQGHTELKIRQTFPKGSLVFWGEAITSEVELG